MSIPQDDKMLNKFWRLCFGGRNLDEWRSKDVMTHYKSIDNVHYY